MKRAKDGSLCHKRQRMGMGGRLVLATGILLAACVVTDAVVQGDNVPLQSGEMQVVQSAEVEDIEEEQPVEAEAVQAAKVDETDDAGFFAARRLEKERVRSQEIELLQELAEAETTTAEARTQAENRVMQITADMETELVLEGLLAGKYGGEALVFIQDGRVDVILAPALKEIDANEAARIAEMADSYAGVGFENTVVTLR